MNVVIVLSADYACETTNILHFVTDINLNSAPIPIKIFQCDNLQSVLASQRDLFVMTSFEKITDVA